MPAAVHTLRSETAPERSLLERIPVPLRVGMALLLVYVFLAALGLMGAGFKAMGRGFAEQLISATSNPFLGLFVGVLATSMVQSSSLTTALVVGMVSGGTLEVRGAIPIIMGANIGTTVTNSIVSLGFAGDDDAFRRSFACGTVHDFFNLLCVSMLLPLELLGQQFLGAGPLEAIATRLSYSLAGASQVKFAGPVKAAVKPLVKTMTSGLMELGGAATGAWLCVGFGLVLVCLALWSLTATLKSVIFGSGLLDRVSSSVEAGAGRHTLAGVVVGALLTALVQSSSITTSLLVPMAAAGLITVHQAFPITVGANLGTTVTAMLASLGGTGAGLTIALVHLLFNLVGALLFLPFPRMRRIPIQAAEKLVELTERSRWWAVAYVGVLFFGIPGLLMCLR